MRNIIKWWGGHAHSHGPERIDTATLQVSPAARVIALTVLISTAIATVLGLVTLWPDYDRAAEVAGLVEHSASGVTYERGEILGLEEGCAAARETLHSAATNSEADSAAQAGADHRCLSLNVGLHTGEDAGRMVDVTVRGGLATAGLRVGDEVQLVGYPRAAEASGDAANGGVMSDDAALVNRYEIERSYEVSGVFRGLPLLLLGLVFVAVVVVVGRMRGVLALLALGISAGVIAAFVLPALVAGGPGIPIAFVAASAIMFVTLYLVHGPNLRTTAALIGTLFGIAMMALVSVIAVSATRLSGIGDEAAGTLSAVATNIDFRGLLSCAIIISGLGILNDVTITQASAVWELRAAAPALSRREIYDSAMRIGRDHIASTVYTVFFSYVGAAMSVLIVLYLYDRPVLQLLTGEDLVTEIVRTLCGSIGLVLAVPLTTWIAVLFVPPGTAEISAAFGANRRPTPNGSR